MDASTQLVVRNSFLELFDDMPALGPLEPQRPRAMTDITGTRQAYDSDSFDDLPTLAPVEPQQGLRLESIGRRLGDGLRLDSNTEPCYGESPHHMAPMGKEPVRVSTQSDPQYAGMSHSGSNAMPVYSAAPWWGYHHPAAANGLNPMANCFWGYQPYQGGGAPQASLAKPQGKAKAKTKAKTANGKQDVQAGPVREDMQGNFGQGPAATFAQAPKKGEQPAAPVEVSKDSTTVMLRNIPNRYTQGMLLQLLDAQGFPARYDFVYLPMDFRNAVNLGYAFVNLLSHDYALELMGKFQDFAEWMFDSSKVCEVSWAHPHQGLNEHVERYRNSPVMHPSMPEEYKPMVFKDGLMVPFPAPTKVIRAPKLRPVRDRGNTGAEAGQEAPSGKSTAEPLKVMWS